MFHLVQVSCCGLMSPPRQLNRLCAARPSLLLTVAPIFAYVVFSAVAAPHPPCPTAVPHVAVPIICPTATS